jgi:predicted metalloprotease with PDZ domain
MTVGAQVVAVNGTAFDGDRLKSAISDAKQRGAISDAKQNASAIELLVKTGDRFRTVVLDYHDGLRYPHLERDGSGPARLDQILTPRK